MSERPDHRDTATPTGRASDLLDQDTMRRQAERQERQVAETLRRLNDTPPRLVNRGA